LTSIEEHKRVKAVKFLAGSNDPRVIHSLQKVAEGDQSLQIRFLAKEGLQQIRSNLTQKIGIDFTDNTVKATSNVRPIDVKKLALALQSKSATTRSNAVKAAMSYLNPQALNAIIPHLKVEREIKVKRNCIMALGILGNKDHIPLLLHYLEHKEPHYRLKAISGLSCLTEISTYPRLVNSIDDENKHVRHAALATVLKLGKPKVLKLIYKMVLSKHVWMRIAAAKACGKLKSSQVIKILAACLNDRDEDVKKAARGSLRRLEQQGVKSATKLLEAYKMAGGELTLEDFILPSDIESLSSLLNDEDPKVRNAEIQRMVEEKDTGLIDMAIARLAVEEDKHVKSSLIIAIGRLHGVEAIESVKPFLKADSPRIVASAVEALSFIDSPSVIPLLIPFLDSEDNRTCANAIVALKDSPEADVIPSLKRLALNDQRNYKLSAIYAILEIHTPEATAILDLMEGSPDAMINERLTKAREILSDTTFSTITRTRSKTTAQMEIPVELTINSPNEDSGKPVTKQTNALNTSSFSELNDRQRDNLNSSDNSNNLDNLDDTEDDLDDTEDDLDDSTSDFTDSKEANTPNIDNSPLPESSSETNSAKNKSNQPGFRTQIDQMFVQAAKEPTIKKTAKAVKKPSKDAAKEVISREGLLDKIRNILSPKDSAPTADGATNPSNIIIICAGVVIAFLVIYMLTSGGGGDDYEDNYSSDEF
jgi:HEAT repeat protein